MTVATFAQPDSTNPSQNPVVWGGYVDGDISIHHRLAGPFAAHEQAVPNMTVAVDAGHVFVGTTLIEVAAQSTGTITAPVSNPRIDRVVVDRTTGAVSVITGAENASLIGRTVDDTTPPNSVLTYAPAITASTTPICRVLLQTTSTAITNSMIADERVVSASGGPSSSTAHSVALYSDAVGTFKDGPALGTAGQVLTSNGAGADPSFQDAPVTSAQFLALQQDVIQNYLLDAINGAWAAGQYSNGGYDAFNSDTLSGVSGTSNQTYDGTNKLYYNAGQSQVSQSTGTNSGDLTSGGGLAAAFDGNTSQTAAAGASTAGNITTANIGKDYGVSGQMVTGWKIWGPSDAGIYTAGSTVTVQLYGSNSAFGTGGTALGSPVSFTDANGATSQNLSCSNSTAYRYVWLTVSQSGAATNCKLAEVEFFAGPLSPPNMTLVGAALSPAPSTAPTKAQLMVLWKDLSTTTNLLKYSQDPTQTAWSKTRASIGTTTTDPNGGTSAYKVIEDNTNGTHQIVENFVSTAATYIASAYVKAAERTACSLSIWDGSVDHVADFNLSTGAVIAADAGVTASISAAANGFYRCVISLTPAASATASMSVKTYNGARGYTGDGVSGIYVYGMQTEQASVLGAYVATTSASASGPSAILNTDFTAEATENGGTNWVTATLTDSGITMGAGPYKVLTGTATLSSGGTTVQYRLKTLNNKQQRVKAVGLMTQ